MLVALAGAMQTLGHPNPGPTVTATLDGKNLVGGRPVTFPLDRVGTHELANTGRHELLLTNVGPGPAFFAWTVNHASAAAPVTVKGKGGIRIRRSYEDMERHPIAGAIPVGTVLRVVLNVDAGESSSWVRISDPFAPGLVPVTRSDGTLVLAGLPAPAGGVWVEPTDDHLAVYLRRLARTGRTPLRFSYLVRAVTPGRFGVPPPRVEPLYRPESSGRGETATLVVVNGPG